MRGGRQSDEAISGKNKKSKIDEKPVPLRPAPSLGQASTLRVTGLLNAFYSNNFVSIRAIRGRKNQKSNIIFSFPFFFLCVRGVRCGFKIIEILPSACPPFRMTARYVTLSKRQRVEGWYAWNHQPRCVILSLSKYDTAFIPLIIPHNPERATASQKGSFNEWQPKLSLPGNFFLFPYSIFRVR